jgi:hypothetical protein
VYHLIIPQLLYTQGHDSITASISAACMLWIVPLAFRNPINFLTSHGLFNWIDSNAWCSIYWACLCRQWLEIRWEKVGDNWIDVCLCENDWESIVARWSSWSWTNISSVKTTWCGYGILPFVDNITIFLDLGDKSPCLLFWIKCQICLHSQLSVVERTIRLSFIYMKEERVRSSLHNSWCIHVHLFFLSVWTSVILKKITIKHIMLYVDWTGKGGRG